MLAEVKVALRVTSNRFDGEIETLIKACKIDLSIAGVTVLDEEDPVIKRAIILYAKANFGYDNPDSEKFQKSYELLRCSLVLAGDYNGTTTLASPKTAVFRKDAALQADVVVMVTNSEVTAVKNATDELTENTEYTKAGYNVTLKKEYLATLEVGAAVITFETADNINPTCSITVIEAPSGGGGGNE